MSLLCFLCVPFFLCHDFHRGFTWCFQMIIYEWLGKYYKLIGSFYYAFVRKCFLIAGGIVLNLIDCDLGCWYFRSVLHHLWLESYCGQLYICCRVVNSFLFFYGLFHTLKHILINGTAADVSNKKNLLIIHNWLRKYSESVPFLLLWLL